MAVAGTLEIQLLANVARLQSDMGRATKTVGGAMSSIERSVSQAKNALLGMAGGFSLALVAREALKTQREFDKLNASLVTATGSTANAAQAFKALQAFAATTPYSVQEATTAFIKMRNMGLDPSEKALRAYGNTSAAMGKSLEQMIEAVADAATGEFERLKEFGIKAKVEGDKVALTFQGNATSIGNNAQEIEKYLQRIGEVEFGGGMALRAATLDGAISNLGDTWSKVMLTIAQGGIGAATQQSVLDLSSALNDLDSILNAVNASYEKAAESGKEVGFIHKGLTTIFETVAVLGIDLAYVLTGIGNELGGLAAQAAAILTGNFSEARTIGEMMKADAEAARIAVDARMAAILGASAKTRAAAQAEAEEKARTGRDDLARYKLEAKAKNELGALTKEQITAAKKLADSQASFITGLEKEVALLGSTSEQQKLYEASVLKITGTRLAAVQSLISQVAAFKEAEEAAKTLKDANQALIDVEYQRITAYEATLPTLLEANKAMAQETELLGLSESAQLQVTQARQASVIAIKEEQLARLQNSEFMSREQIALEYEIQLLKERMGLTQAQGDKNIAVTQANEATAAWKKTADEINQGLTDSLFRAFESGKGFFTTLWDGIKNLFKTTVLRMLITPVTSGITGMLGLGGSANAGGLGGSSLTSSIGIVDTVSKVYSAVTGSFAALGDSVAFAAQDIGAWLVTNTTGTLNSFGSSLMGGAGGLGTMATGLAAAAAGIAIGSLIAGDKVVIGLNGTATSAIGAAIGYAVGGPLGAVIGGALGGIANAAFGMGPKRTTASGISGTFGSEGASGLQNYQNWSQEGGWFRSNKSGTNYSGLDAGASEAINSAVIATGNAVRAYATVIGLSADAVNGFSQSINVSLMGLSAEDANAAVGRAIGNFGEAMASAAYGAALQAFRLANETNTEALSRLATDLTSVNTAFRTMGKTLMAASLAGADASSKLIAMAGGLEEFTTQTNAYYSAFYTQTERTKTATRQLTDALYFMGLEMPATRDAFRELVDAQDLMTDAGRATYSVLIALAPAFDEITTSSAALEAELARLASSTATSLITAFTGRGLFMPSLNATALALATVSTTADTTTGALSSINSILGDASSRVLYFGSAIGNVNAPLDAAQLATLALQNEMIDLSVSASGTIINFAGLSAALANVDTRTFVATVTGVFEVIGQRIRDVLSGIADERISVRDAAINIIGAGGLTAAQISQQITAAMVGMPNNNGVMAAQSALSAADARARATASAASSASGAYGNAVNTLNNNQNSILSGINTTAAPRTNSPGQTANAIWESIIGPQWQAHVNRYGIGWNTHRTSDSERAGNMNSLVGQYDQRVRDSNVPVYAAAAAQLIADQAKVAAAYSASSAAATTAAQATAAQTAAATAAKNAQLAYIASLQQYAVDAGKAVKQLGALRQETVNYFETQKQLADLMNSSASSLRQTVADYRFGLMDPRDQLAQLQERFNVAYSMALSTSGDVLAGYGSEINALINPLLQKAQEAGLSGSEYAGLISTTLARADAVAARLEAMAPADYQLESLALLAQIDATLAALETGALTADQIVVNAIKAGSDTTANGLRAVIAAITGSSIPAFANGGYHTGGMRLVGENGPEMEATGPSRIYNASQTRGMFAGGSDNTEVVAELRALRQDNANMRSELQAIASFTNKSAKLLDRWDGEGAPVRVAIGETFAVETTATTTAGA